MKEQVTMKMTLVGRGDVIVLGIPATGDYPPINVAMSDASFVQGVKALIAQAKHHPSSMLRKIHVMDGR
jgi:hypothetical protein